MLVGKPRFWEFLLSCPGEKRKGSKWIYDNKKDDSGGGIKESSR